MAQTPETTDLLEAVEDLIMDLHLDDRLVGLRVLIERLPDALLQAIGLARDEGWTWGDIGDALGTSRQGAFNRYHGKTARAFVDPNQAELFTIQ